MASTQRLPQAAPRAAVTAAADEDLDESPEAVTKEVFKPYQCRCSSIVARGAVPHAGDIAEASSLRCVVVARQRLWMRVHLMKVVLSWKMDFSPLA
jgi:hypothetical protein